MNIFLSFLQGKPGHPIPAYGFWEYYIKSGIEEAGHSWIETPGVDWAYGLVPQSKANFIQWKEEAWDKTVKFLKSNKVDLFLSYLYPHQIDENALSEIRKMGIPTVNFFCDNIREFHKIPKQYKAFDLNWVPEFKALEMYKNSNTKFIHLPMPMWVEPKFRTLPITERSQVSFIGSRDIQRQLLFEQVVEQDLSFELCIYGAAWQQVATESNEIALPSTLKDKLFNQLDFVKKRGIIPWYRKLQQRNLSLPISDTLKKTIKGKPSFDEYLKITQESFITLGVNRYPSFRYPLLMPDTYSRLRDLEAPMLGACYLTEFTAGIEDMYDIGIEIETYRSPEELVSKAELLLKDKDRRNLMRKKGQEKALQKHSIPNSLEKIRDHFSLKG